jgi:hypothetical protein
VHVRAGQRVEEPERVAVIDDLVLVGDDPEHLAGVLADVGLVALRRDQLGRVLGPELVGRFRGLDDEHVAVGDPPAQAGPVERLVDRFRVLVEDDAKAVPRDLADGEHLVVAGDAMRHGVTSP